MIDLGLSKLALIGVAALVVIGPERLPKVARYAGSLWRRAQHYIGEVKAEVSREMDLDTLRKMEKHVRDATQEIESAITQNISLVESRHDSAGCSQDDVLRQLQTTERIALKAKGFRKKKLAQTASVPSWYKRRHISKTRIVSRSERVAKYRYGSST